MSVIGRPLLINAFGGTKSGDIVSFGSSLKVGIEPVQAGSGDPSPDNVRPISGWSAVNVWRTGKNLYNAPDPSTLAEVTLSKLDDGKFELNGTCESSANFTRTINSITIKKGTYTISFGNETAESNQTRCDIYLSGISRTFQATSGTVSGETTFTLDSDYTGTISYRIRVNAGVTYTHFVVAPQLEPGSPATAYEPYSGAVYPITFPAAAGTVYGGTLDVLGGVLRITLKGFSYSSVDYYGIYAEHPLYMMNIPDYSTEKIKLMTTQQKPGVLISNIFKKTTGSSAGALGDCEIRTNDGTTASKFYFRADSFADLTALNAYLSTNPLQVVAELETPVTYTMTPEEVGTILLQVGRNNVWADTGPVTFKFFN